MSPPTNSMPPGDAGKSESRRHHSHHSGSSHSHHSSSHSHHSHRSHRSEPQGRFERVSDSDALEESNLPNLRIDEVFLGEPEQPQGSKDELPVVEVVQAPEKTAEELAVADGEQPQEAVDELPVVTAEQLPEDEASDQTLPTPEELKPKRSRGRKVLSVLLVIVLVIFCIGAAALLWLSYQTKRGRENMLADYEEAELVLPTDDERIQSDTGGKTVRYNGKLYQLNPNLATILFMGIDREEMESTEGYGYGGQADVIMLIVEDTETGRMEILNISRDTYAAYTVYTADGEISRFDRKQISQSYAAGDGREKSCENTKKAVQDLLYGMPISRYVAMDMDGVVAANEAVGGVELNTLIDFQLADGTQLKAGDRVTLHNQDADHYLRTRGHDLEGNNRRIERTKQYVSRFASTVVQQAKSDFRVIPSLYKTVMPYVVTDLELSDLIFLARVYMDCGAEFEFRSLTGEMDWMENQFDVDIAVFYPDEDNLFETVLDLFYTEVDESN